MANGNGRSSQVLYYASRPIISIDGQVNSQLGETLLIDLMVEETTLGLFRCEARFANWMPGQGETFVFFDGQTVDFGKAFEVEMGKPGDLQKVFKGRIMGLEAQYPAQRAPELVVLAEDRFQDLRMERRTRAFEDVSDGDVVQQIASDQRLTAEVDVDGPNYRVLTQVNQSDLAFLRERAAAVDAELWIDDRTVHFQARTQRDAGEISLEYGASLLEFTVLADLAHQRTSVRISGWDVSNKDALDVDAAESAIRGELNGDRSGSALLGQALAERHERIVTAVPQSQSEAQALAQARYRQRARRFVTGSGVADGEAGIRVGTTLQLSGLGPYFDGRYYVTLARHVFDLMHGHRTEFEVERPGLGQAN